MIVYNKLNNSFFDKDSEGQISKVCRNFHGDNNYVTFPRFNFADNGEYVELNAADIELIIKNQTDDGLVPIECDYYIEDGSRPLRTLDCNQCHNSNGCFHHQKYYDKIKHY